MFKSTFIGPDHTDSLNLFTDSHTASAEDTFAVIPDHMHSRIINFTFEHFPVILMFIGHTQVTAELLKLTVSAADAGQTFFLMVGKKKLQCLFP